MFINDMQNKYKMNGPIMGWNKLMIILENKISATCGKSPREIVDYCLISFWLVLNNILFGFSFKLCKYMFIMDTIHRIKNNEPMPWIFLSGGAGVGKTMTINHKESLDFIVMSMWTFALHELCMSQLCETTGWSNKKENLRFFAKLPKYWSYESENQHAYSQYS